MCYHAVHAIIAVGDGSIIDIWGNTALVPEDVNV